MSQTQFVFACWLYVAGGFTATKALAVCVCVCVCVCERELTECVLSICCRKEPNRGKFCTGALYSVLDLYSTGDWND